MGRSADLGLEALGSKGASTFLYGTSRAVVNRLLYAMARAVDPEPIWVDLGPGSLGGKNDAGPVELGWIPSHRLFLTWDTEQARPQDAVGNLALSGVVRADEPAESVTRLADFVRLAPLVQELISRVDAAGPRHALAVANSDRVRGDYPNTVNGIEPIVKALIEAPFCPFFGAQGVPGPGRMAFSYVLEVRARDVAHWRDGSLVIEKSPSRERGASPETIDLIDIPGLADVFEAAPARGQSP